MNVSAARIIDYWVGVPACFFLTLLRKAKKLLFFNGREQAGVSKKFLFIELSEMGSAILAYPAMKYIKDSYPEAELFFMIFEKNRASVDILKTIPKENVLTVNIDSVFNFFRDSLKNIIRMRRERFDAVFDLELFARSTAILTYLSGAPKRVGFYKYKMEGLYRGNLLTHKIQYNFQQHISKTFFSFVKSAENAFQNKPTMDNGIFPDNLTPAVYEPGPDNIKLIWEKLKKINPAISERSNIVILNPSGGDLPIRSWPVENFTALAGKILEDKNNFVVLTGAKSDIPVVEKINSAFNSEKVIDLSGKTEFGELLDLYCVSDVLVTSDSGPGHFASLTPIKNFVFFGPESPNLYSPLGENTKIFFENFPCSPCLSAFNHRSTVCEENKCVKAISVDKVYELIEKELKK
ncbi:MAG: glycosyltransferase family 9 protein [Candidatus Pacebacteria bacterium]|nr:glycosyltransferase family 9 protein [Candidatus Paceibacterota bacterium]